jgi:hypothetical protein
LAPKGIWFLSPDWAKKSVAEKKRLPEIDHCVPGGTLAGSTSALEVVEAGIPQQTPDAVKTANKHTGFLDKSFKTLKASGLTEQEIAENMHSRVSSSRVISLIARVAQFLLRDGSICIKPGQNVSVSSVNYRRCQNRTRPHSPHSKRLCYE